MEPAEASTLALGGRLDARRPASLLLRLLAALALAAPLSSASMGLPDGIDNILGFVPTSSFRCERDGYFGDTDNDCRIFHLCQRQVLADGRSEWRHWTYACGNQTMFNQLTLTCAFVDEAIPCRHASQFQYLNEVIHKPREPFLTDADVTSGLSYYSNRVMSDGARARAFEDSQLMAQIGGGASSRDADQPPANSLEAGHLGALQHQHQHQHLNLNLNQDQNQNQIQNQIQNQHQQPPEFAGFGLLPAPAPERPELSLQPLESANGPSGQPAAPQPESSFDFSISTDHRLPSAGQLAASSEPPEPAPTTRPPPSTTSRPLAEPISQRPAASPTLGITPAQVTTTASPPARAAQTRVRGQRRQRDQLRDRFSSNFHSTRLSAAGQQANQRSKRSQSAIVMRHEPAAQPGLAQVTGRAERLLAGRRP